ncbi:hypothetical protein [Streptomyces cyaneofuscatus]|uniref:hypothetical protein n=1 Tax=Streptomyces cyaneofuscatus TaxID=66883 RepID=UPI0034120FE5
MNRLSVNVEIAHIRAEKPGGARYDPAFEGKRGNAEDNLLLLCTKHHKWVDDFGDDYPTEELLAWKAEQVAQGRGASLTEHQVEQIFLAFTTPRAGVEVVGVIRAGGENVVSKIENLKAFKLLSEDMEEQFLGVRVSNVGALGFDVDGVGLEIDIDGPASMMYLFPVEHILHRPFKRLEPQANSVWLDNPLSVGAGIRRAGIPRGYVPVRFRAFADLGSGSRTPGTWVSAVHLPIWADHVSQEWLDGLVALGRRARGEIGGSAH